MQLLIKNPWCKKVVVVTRRKTGGFADPKVSELVVSMDRLEQEVAPHARSVDVALAAFGVGKGSAKMPEEEVRKIEIAYPQAFCRAAKAAGARVCGVMTAAGANPNAGMKYAKIIGEKEKAVESVKFEFIALYRPAVILGNSNTPGVLGYVMPLLQWAMPSKYHSIHKNDLARDGGAVGAGIPRDRAGQRSHGGNGEDSGVQGYGAFLRQGRERRALRDQPQLEAPFPSRSGGGLLLIVYARGDADYEVPSPAKAAAPVRSPRRQWPR
ncbi:MAG TPA: hypothetical protein VNV13_15160 [Steroidobacteraceae bacterium]|nr:hypothetical protein [Steroidobacteraceae bacterium]